MDGQACGEHIGEEMTSVMQCAVGATQKVMMNSSGLHIIPKA